MLAISQFEGLCDLCIGGLTTSSLRWRSGLVDCGAIWLCVDSRVILWLLVGKYFGVPKGSAWCMERGKGGY